KVRWLLFTVDKTSEGLFKRLGSLCSSLSPTSKVFNLILSSNVERSLILFPHAYNTSRLVSLSRPIIVSMLVLFTCSCFNFCKGLKSGRLLKGLLPITTTSRLLKFEMSGNSCRLLSPQYNWIRFLL